MNNFKSVDGQQIKLTAKEEQDLVDKASQHVIDQKAYVALEYSRNRATEYPALADQLDEIYHNGIDSWKAVIKVTKDKYPKG